MGCFFVKCDNCLKLAPHRIWAATLNPLLIAVSSGRAFPIGIHKPVF